MWGHGFDRIDLKQDLMVLVEGKAVPFACVSKSKGCERVVEVDVVRAWKELGLKAGWSNEVGVEMLVMLPKR